jgi:hypothetical protein
VSDDELTPDELLLVLNDHVGAHVLVTVRFRTEEPLASFQGDLRSQFQVASENAQALDRNPAEFMAEDENAGRAVYYVGDEGAGFAVPNGPLNAEHYDDDAGVFTGVLFGSALVPVETLVLWSA